MEKKRKPRVLLSKLGLDGHERGIIVVALALRDAGMEVIYLGKHNSAETIVKSAVEEDVDIVGLSSLADAHRTLAPKVVKLLRERGCNDIPVILGGFIQPEDIPMLKQAGIAEVFGIGSRLESIVESVHNCARK
jgi:methylmalonyl-CoA mutase C-terminal domain/subunit